MSTSTNPLYWTTTVALSDMLFLFSLSSLELFDSHDDRDDEGESVEEHKSVIMHLLSQVRLGMDLTKVNIGARCFFFLSTCSATFFLSNIIFLQNPHFKGGPAYLHSRKKVFIRNVCRLFCTS